MRNQITHICICGSAYALLQYLLLQSKEDSSEHTFFFVGSGVDATISRNLSHCKRFDTLPAKGIKRVKRIFEKIYLRCFGRMLYPFIRKAEIYAQDYLFPVVLIGRNTYRLLNESPYFFTINYSEDSCEYKRCKNHLHSLSGKIESFLYGKPLVFLPGQTSLCKEILLTEPNNSPLLLGKKYRIDSFKTLWDLSDESKKEYILSVFNMSNDDLISQKYIFLTQPLVKDGLLTDDEYKELLQKIFCKYDHTQLCIKVHPRDDYDYSRVFPDIQIYTKPVNLELLLMLNQKCDKVISIFSTAVNSIPEDIEVDWFGTSVHPKLVQYSGNTVVPYRKYNKVYIE